MVGSAIALIVATADGYRFKASCQVNRQVPQKGDGGMKTSCMKDRCMTVAGRITGQRPAVVRDEFEDVLVAELEELRKSEKALQEMYPRLKSKPQLRVAFLRQLADMQRRTERLDAVLNPTGALQLAPAPAQSAVGW